MTEEQERECAVQVIRWPHYPTLVTLGDQFGVKPEEVLEAVNRRMPKFGGFLLGTTPEALYTARHVRLGAALRQDGKLWSHVWRALNLEKTNKGKAVMRGKIEALLAERRDEVEKDLADGVTGAEMAKKYGLSEATVCNLKKKIAEKQDAETETPEAERETEPEPEAEDEAEPAPEIEPDGMEYGVTGLVLAETAAFIAALPARYSSPKSVRITADRDAVQTDLGGEGWKLTLTVLNDEKGERS